MKKRKIKNRTLFAKIRNSKFVKSTMAFVGISMLAQIISPTVAMALTSGAASPEFSSFEPVATTDMVNDFTGDFAYNLPVLSIPGPDGGGYSMSLSYHSGTTPEEEASWVGFGWTLNPGAINRQKRGFADDFNAVDVTKYNKVKPNWTHASSFNFNVEINSADKKEDDKADAEKKKEDKAAGEKAKFKFDGINGFGGNNTPPAPDEDDNPFAFSMNVSLSKTVKYNNYSGFSMANGFSLGVMGMASLNMNRSGGENTYGLSINPLAFLSKRSQKKAKNLKKESKKNYKSGRPESGFSKELEAEKQMKKSKALGANASSYSAWSYNAPAVPYSVAYNTGRAYNMSISLQINPYGPLGFQMGIRGHMNWQANYPEVGAKGYGYMYNPSIDDYEGNLKKVYDKNHDGVYNSGKDANPENNIEADYQIEKASTFNKHDRNLGIPFNSADVFSATGNGVMGGFQIHRTRIGHFRPSFVANEQKIGQIGVEVGVGGTLSIGLDVALGFQKTMVGDWKKVESGTNGDLRTLSENELLNFEFSDYTANNTFMRFNGDMGGEVKYSDDDELLFAKVGGSLFNRKLNITDIGDVPAADLKNDLDLVKEEQTSHIAYSVYDATGELSTWLDSSPNILAEADSKGAEYKDLIGQISVLNKDGNKSVYGLPVFSKDESELTVAVGTSNVGESNAALNQVSFTKNHELFFDRPLKNKTAIGSRTSKPWASTYLLTQTTTFDYLDVDAVAGPSDGDFGGWTKFRYNKVYGNGIDTDSDGNDDWYKYRAPYTGLFYNRGRLMDRTDQTGSMSCGLKESYYLKAIETKTHIAFFVTNNTNYGDFSTEFATESGTLDISGAQNYITGSGDDRHDALGANEEIGTDPSDIWREKAAEGELGDKRLQKLEKIVLFAKGNMNEPISTTYFEYDYELCPGVPNSKLSGAASGGTTSSGEGKLTLKRVWTEGGRSSQSRIAPYQFEYNYFRDYSDRLVGTSGKYQELKDVYTGLAAANENPEYKQGQQDMWGNYRINEEDRFKEMRPWVDQRENPSEFDPAAWQLKRIILPSGGEIHVQYEQKDYLYVQDERAMAMVNLLENPNVDLEAETGTHKDDKKKYGYISGDKSRYYINHETIGVSTAELEAYETLLYDYFINSNQKLYFKFLYNLKNTAEPSLTSFDQNVEYVSGYTTVNNVDKDVNGIYLELGELKDNGNGKKDKTLPRWVAYQMLLTSSRFNLLTGDTDSQSFATQTQDADHRVLGLAYDDDGYGQDGQYSSVPSEVDATDNVVELHYKLIKKGMKKMAKDLTFDYFGKWVGGKIKNIRSKNACRVKNEELSYLKLPVYHSKKGGGCRVKRLLSYDPGINGETGDDMVYGSEYIYRMAEYGNLSSGVATNEPASGREENALVKMLERNKQKSINKLTKGRDSKQVEGPLGESLLPGASIGYSRVIIKNIHSGETTTGFAVNEYYTVKDFPMEVDFSELSKKNDSPTYKKFNLSLPLGMINLNFNNAWLTQGYLFKLNDMHGKPKSQTTYAGNYVSSSFAQSNGMASAKTVYNYSDLGSEITSLLYDPDGKTFEIGKMRPGVEEDLTMYRSKVKDRTNDFSVELDLNITLPYVISLGFGITYNYSESQLSQHVTTKVLRQKSYLLSTTSTVDGVTQTTENLAFNKHTGDPVLTRTYDGYMAPTEEILTESSVDGTGNHDGHYYALNIPASWAYSDLANKSIASTNTNQLTASVGNVVTYGGNDLYAAIQNNDPSYSSTFNNVINASAVVLKQNWFLTNEFQTELESEYANLNSNVSSLNNHYYPLRSYVYRGAVKNANSTTTNTNIYNGGVLSSSVDLFDWFDETQSNLDQIDVANGDWFSASKVMAYSPNGIPLVEKDILDIYSTAHFGYNKTLPVLVAQNADYNQVRFIDFEQGNFAPTNTSNAHSGYNSYEIGLNSTLPIITNYNFNSVLLRGVSIKLWLKSQLSASSGVNEGKVNPNPQLKAIIDNQQFSFKKIAQTGEWTLYETRINNLSTSSTTADVELSYNKELNELVLIDDVRIQPLDAVMNCTVYTIDNKVTAQFDDQHFGVFYEYNSKGQLVRKSIETERGRKTIQEQQYNVPLINKN